MVIVDKRTQCRSKPAEYPQSSGREKRPLDRLMVSPSARFLASSLDILPGRQRKPELVSRPEHFALYGGTVSRLGEQQSTKKKLRRRRTDGTIVGVVPAGAARREISPVRLRSVAGTHDRNV